MTKPKKHYAVRGAFDAASRSPEAMRHWKDADALSAYFTGLPHGDTGLALEFEDNLVDWSDAMYEVQILI